jgi:glutamyl-tRNA reductase
MIHNNVSKKLNAHAGDKTESAEIDLVGINHKTAPLALREPVALTDNMIEEGLTTALEHTQADEVMILSTCNRTELIFVGAQRNLDTVWTALCQHINLETLKHAIYHAQNDEAIRHLIEVGSGIDSMIIGETEIVAQLKKAFMLATKAETAGPLFRRLMPKIFEAIKMVRKRTQSFAQPSSIAHAACQKVMNETPTHQKKKVLLIGTGTIARLIASQLTSQVDTLHVVYRSAVKAEWFKTHCKATCWPTSQLDNAIAQATIVIAATNSPIPLITKEVIPETNDSTQHRLLLDLAVPRDIDPAIAKQSNVTLYNIDTITDGDAQTHTLSFSNQKDHASLICEQTERITTWLEAQSALRHIRRFRSHIEALAEQTIEMGLKNIESGKDPSNILPKLIRQMTHKILHIPTVQLRKAALSQRMDIVHASAFLLHAAQQEKES